MAASPFLQTRREKFKKIAKGTSVAFAIYIIAYVINSAAGGYWMIPGRDGRARWKPEFGGLSMTVAIMWQPRLGHNALGKLDYLGLLFQPLILLDRAWLHQTHYLMDDGFDAWLKRLSPSKVHPKFREEFIRERARAPQPKPEMPNVSVRQGERDLDRKLVLHVFNVRDRHVPVSLYTDFGFMLFNVGTEEWPVSRFVLGSDRDSRVTVFSTLQEFTNALAALPPASALHHYDKCSAPTSWGLDTNILHTIERFCASRRITVTNAPFVTCTCPN